MGLDVYLYHSPDWDETIRREEGFEAAAEKVYDEIENDEERDIRLKALAESWGMKEPYDDPAELVMIEEPSTLYPDHMYKIGYFRSSYNSGGINSVLRDRLDKDLYWVFPEGGLRDSDRYLAIDWEAARDRAKELLVEFQNYLGAGPQRSVIEISPLFTENTIASKAQALEVANRELARETTFGAWANHQGEFYPKGLKVLAAISGIGFANRPATYLIYDNEGGFDWYVQALEIVVETCEWVLAQGNPSSYRLVWSG